MIINHLLLWHFLPVISTAAKTSIRVSSSSHLLQVTFTHTTTTKTWTQVHVTMVPNSSSISKFFKCIKEPMVFKKQPGKEPAIL
jgi:hypothetical protein